MAIPSLLRVSSFRDGLVLRANRQNLQGVAEVTPGIQAALERPNMPYAFFPEEKRHTGAGGFVWSSTVEDDFAVARQPLVGLLEFARVHAKGAGDRLRVGLEVNGMAQIHDRERFTGVQFFLQLFRADAGNSQFAEESLAGHEFVANIKG